MSETDRTHPSDLALDQGGPDFAAHVASCDHCRARVHAAGQIRATFDNVVFPNTVAAVRAAGTRTQPRRRATIWLLVGGPAALAAAGIVLVLAVGPRSHHASDAQPTPGAGMQGIKGPAGLPLEIIVKRGGDVFRLSDGRSLQPGDGLRFVYRGATPRQATLWMRDPGGRLVRFFPDGSTSTLISPGDTLPGALVVDAVPGTEHVELWMSAQPFSTTDPGSPAAGVTIYPIDLRKER